LILFAETVVLNRGPSRNFKWSASSCAPYNMECLMKKCINEYVLFAAYLKSWVRETKDSY